MSAKSAAFARRKARPLGITQFSIGSSTGSPFASARSACRVIRSTSLEKMFILLEKLDRSYRIWSSYAASSRSAWKLIPSPKAAAKARQAMKSWNQCSRIVCNFCRIFPVRRTSCSENQGSPKFRYIIISHRGAKRKSGAYFS